MGASTRHYKALMKKNFINWKRTPCGSICEIICPILLMLILVYARTQIDPAYNDNYSLYSLRRPFYPIAKPELDDKFIVSVADQERQLDEYRSFFKYMDVITINGTEIDSEQLVNLVEDVAVNVTGVPNAVYAAVNLKEDIRTVTNLNRMVQNSPIANFTETIDWDALARVLRAFGLDAVFDIVAIEEFVQQIEDTLEDPEGFILALTNIDINQQVEEFLEQIPDIPDLENISIEPGYLPIFDITGPYSFFPSHCYPGGVEAEEGKKNLKSVTRFNSPIIAYVKTGASIEMDIVDQLESLFKFQRNVQNSLAGADLLGLLGGLISDFSQATSSYIRTDEFQAIGDQFTERFGGNYTDQVDEFANDLLGSNATSELIAQASKNLGNFKFRAFESTEALDDYISSDKIGSSPEYEGICFGFKIHENDEQNKYELELFFNDMWPSWLKAIPTQKQPAWNSYEYEPRIESYTEWSTSGFANMQNWVANTILKRKTGIDTASIVTMAVPTKLPPFVEDDFGRLLSAVLAFFLVIMYVPPIYRTAYRIVQEKENKVKESMRMMGLKDFPYWASWFTYYTIVNTCISTITWIIMFTSICKKSSPILLFFTVWLFGQSLFGILLITQSVFAKARAAAIVASIVYFGSSIFNYFLTAPDTLWKYRMIGSLSPTVNLIQTITVLAQFESSQKGATMELVFAEYNQWSMGDGLIMQALNCVWIPLLGMYLEQVMPKTFGTRAHPCFCFKWCCRKKSRNGIIDGDEQTNKNKIAIEATANPSKHDTVDQTLKFETKTMNPDCYEKLTPDKDEKEIQNQVLKINNLHKVYENGFKAVNGLNFKMFSNEIFCLLGHNGAGKTSTISMLTGLINSSQGNVDLFGMDMFSRMDDARKVMGVCPQHDVLFDLLTPAEHLDIFYEFKGADKTNKKKEIDQILKDIGVDDKKNNSAFELSGGNKRKLSVAIALCGNSKFVLLDEPTSGLDIQARRQLWNVLREYKKDRIILLTTHYMDEADILGDRIGIMTGGKMTCLGTSLFLKNRFGAGYAMTIVKSNAQQNKKLMPYMHDRLGPLVQKQTEIAGEMTIQIPKQYTHLFRDFFASFDDDLESLDVTTYGMSVTTLEQVFLEIGHNPNPKPIILHKSNSEQQQEGRSQDGDVLSTPLHEKANITEENPEGETGKKVRPGEELKQNDQAPSFLPPISEKFLYANDAIIENHEKLDPEISHREDSITPFDAEVGGNDRNFKVIRPKRKSDPQDMERQTPGLTAQDEAPVDRFCLADNKLDTSFCNNFCAVMMKRFNSYRRSKKRVGTEVILPSAFMILGVWISSIDFSFRTPSKLFEPSQYPLKQKILMNEFTYDVENSDLSPQIFAENLPDYENAFDVQYREEQPGETFDDFAEAVYQYGVENSQNEPYMYGTYEIFHANKTSQEYKFVNYINLTSDLSVVTFPAYMYESILKVATGDPEFEFKTRSTPYPITYEIKRRTATSDAGAIIFFAAIAYSIVITVTISYLVVERTTQLKHVQVITGMRLTSYWIANFIFDSLKLYVTIATTIALFHIFEQVYESATIVFLMFPFAIMPFTYVMSFIFSTDSAAQTFTMFCHMVIILCFSSLIFILRVVPNLELLGDRLHYGMRVFPTYSLATSLYTDASIEFLSKIRNETEGKGEDISPDVYDLKNNSLDIMLQAGHFVFWTLILFLIEADLGKRIRKCYYYCIKKSFPNPKKDLKLDQDVTDEIERISLTPADQLKIKVQDLRKVYQVKGNCFMPTKALVAVEKISFGLDAGECFALLGVNGAGKSTTFKSLTSEVEPTSGSIHIGSFDIRKDFNNIKKLIGYCPQTNPIFDYMSVEENIEYFARIKGIPKDKRGELIERAIKQLDLTIHRKKLAGTLSGGNKRKLSVAQAIVGSPPIILLDEPSAGMDPEARRFMWKVVGQIASDKTSAVILTTHSMEEAEALSSKMGIMVKGGIFKCFGTSQHIKDKFGTGFVIEIKAQMPELEEIEEVRESILSPEDENLQEALKRPTLTAEETSLLLTQAQIPGIVIESILNLDQTPGSGDDVEEAADRVLKKTFTPNEIAQELFVKGALYGVIESLCKDFINVEVIEHYGSYMRLRVERHSKSIGYLFKIIEELKEEHQLEEYSVSQTSLEQIFQGFADLKFNENVPTFCIDEETGELAKIMFE